MERSDSVTSFRSCHSEEEEEEVVVVIVSQTECAENSSVCVTPVAAAAAAAGGSDGGGGVQPCDSSSNPPLPGPPPAETTTPSRPSSRAETPRSFFLRRAGSKRRAPPPPPSSSSSSSLGPAPGAISVTPVTASATTIHMQLRDVTPETPTEPSNRLVRVVTCPFAASSESNTRITAEAPGDVINSKAQVAFAHVSPVSIKDTVVTTPLQLITTGAVTSHSQVTVGSSPPPTPQRSDSLHIATTMALTNRLIKLIDEESDSETTDSFVKVHSDVPSSIEIPSMHDGPQPQNIIRPQPACLSTHEPIPEVRSEMLVNEAYVNTPHVIQGCENNSTNQSIQPLTFQPIQLVQQLAHLPAEQLLQLAQLQRQAVQQKQQAIQQQTVHQQHKQQPIIHQQQQAAPAAHQQQQAAHQHQQTTHQQQQVVHQQQQAAPQQPELFSEQIIQSISQPIQSIPKKSDFVSLIKQSHIQEQSAKILNQSIIGDNSQEKTAKVLVQPKISGKDNNLCQSTELQSGSGIPVNEDSIHISGHVARGRARQARQHGLMHSASDPGIIKERHSREPPQYPRYPGTAPLDNLSEEEDTVNLEDSLDGYIKATQGRARLTRSDSVVTVAHLYEDIMVSPRLRCKVTLTNLTVVVLLGAIVCPNTAIILYTIFRSRDHSSQVDWL